MTVKTKLLLNGIMTLALVSLVVVNISLLIGNILIGNYSLIPLNIVSTLIGGVGIYFSLKTRPAILENEELRKLIKDMEEVK